MARLEKELEDFILYEKIILAADETEKELQEEYQRILRGVKNQRQVNVNGAAAVLSAYQEIEQHKKDIERAKVEKANAAAEIKRYLQVLDGVPIVYMRKEESGYMPTRITYAFQLDENGEVLHNQPPQRRDD